MVPAAFVLNSLMVVVLQIPLSRGADDIRTAARMGARSGGVMFLGCALMGLAALAAPGYGPVVVLAGIVALTLGELWMSSATWGLSYGLSPTGRADQMSVFTLGAIIVRTVGPGVVAAAVGRPGTAGWLALGAVMAVAGALVVPVSTRAARRLAPPPLRPV
jgi:hypothetical protein